MLTVVKQFEAPGKSLSGLDTQAAAALIAATSDVALILDSAGVIRDLAFGSKELSAEGCGRWLGRSWAEIVMAESRPKVEAMLREASSKSASSWQQVNHTSSSGLEIPLLYSAVQIGQQGGVLAAGRDLRSVAALQHKLIDAQQSMERDYWRLRHIETRYRMLYQMSSDPVMMVEVKGQKVVEVNPAAGKLLGQNAKWIVGRTFPVGFDAGSARSLQALLVGVRDTGQHARARLRTADSRREIIASVSLVKEESNSLFLIRFSCPPPDQVSTVLQIVKSAPLISGSEPSHPADIPAGIVLTRGAEELSELLVRESLKEIVSATTEHIERYCIESALALKRNNRVAAAKMLGLSRQSLYVKLRRYGLIRDTEA